MPLKRFDGLTWLTLTPSPRILRHRSLTCDDDVEVRYVSCWSGDDEWRGLVGFDEAEPVASRGHLHRVNHHEAERVAYINTAEEKKLQNKNKQTSSRRIPTLWAFQFFISLFLYAFYVFAYKLCVKWSWDFFGEASL